MWQFYLAGSEAAFRHGGLVNWQVQFIRSRDAIPMTRDYMYEEEARLRAADGAYTAEYSPGVQLAAE